MNRRRFTQQLAGTVLASCSFAGSVVLNRPASPDSGKIPAESTFKMSVMLWTVFRDLPFDQRLEKIAEAGYRNVQLVGEYEKWTSADFDRTNAKRRELGITFDCTAGLKYGVSDPDQRELLLADLRRTLPIMERIGCPAIILLSGNRVPGMSRDMQHRSCVETLRAAAGVVQGRSINGEPVRLLLETIDPEENPQYFLTQVAEALEVVQEVNHPQVRLLYDVYHEQIAAGNLIKKLEKCLPYLALVHVADVPGRHEPGTGEIHYENIFRRLAELNYQGGVAMEFYPTGDPVTQLRAARELALQCARNARRIDPPPRGV